MPFRPESLSPYRMTLRSLPGSTGALRSSSMATSSSHLSSVFAHGQHSNLTPSIVNSLNAGILSSDLISYPGVPAQATRCADPLGGVQNRNVRDSVQRQQIPGSVSGPSEFDDSDEWLRCLANGDLDGIIATDVAADFLQMAGSAPVSSSLNSEKCQPMIHQSVPSNSRQLRPTISPPSATNIHSPKRTKARMRWTVEMHDRFTDAVNQLGGSDNATPKAILGLMKVEGLTRDQVKSHLQKYKSAQVKHHSSEGTSVETTMPTEVVPSCVQIIEAFALRVQMEFQKKLHDMVDRTHHDLMEIHSRMLEKHVMNLHELEKRRKLSMDSMSHLSSPAAAAALASASATLPEDLSNSNAKLDADGHVPSTVELQRMPEAGSHGDAGA